MGKRIFIYVLWLLLFCMMSGQVIGQNKSAESHSHTCKTVLALKNNLLYDLALAPNIEVELPLGKRWSLNVKLLKLYLAIENTLYLCIKDKINNEKSYRLYSCFY